jgi:hypothetical protein
MIVHQLYQHGENITQILVLKKDQYKRFLKSVVPIQKKDIIIRVKVQLFTEWIELLSKAILRSLLDIFLSSHNYRNILTFKKIKKFQESITIVFCIAIKQNKQ